jgi:chromosome segregation ATPase
MGADALRALLDRKDLNIDSIDKTMEKIQDTLEDQKQVEEAITIGNEDISNTYLPEVDDEELERELDSLEMKSNSSNRHPTVNLTQPIDTESELLRLEKVLSSLNHPSQQRSMNHRRTKELA